MESKEIFGNKQTIQDAMKKMSFEDYIKYIPKPPLQDWQKEFIESSKKLTLEEKHTIFTISGFICLLSKSYRGFWNPWKLTNNNRDLSFRPDYLTYAYEKIESELTELLKSKDEFVVKRNKEYYEKCYGYYLVEAFLKGIDEVYWHLISAHDIIVEKMNLFEANIVVEFNSLSIRGSHRVKIWPIYMWPTGIYSRRAPIGHFYQLNPSDRHFFDNELSTIDEKVKCLVLTKRIKGRRCNLIDAIHPHISNSEPCLGGWQARLNKDSEYGYAQVFMKDLKRYLCTWSIESPYWNINNQYRHTYQFPAIKGRKNVHWDAIDSMYINKNFPEILSRDSNHNGPRLAMQMKHETGFYTDEFFSRYQNYLMAIKIDDKRAMIILNEIHGINIDNTPRNKPWPINDIGYARIHLLHDYQWSMSGRGSLLTLSNRYSGLNLKNTFIDLMRRVKHCIKNYVNTDLDNINWKDIDMRNVNDVSLADRLSSGKQGNLEKINDVYTILWNTIGPDEFNKQTLKDKNPWEKDDYYNAHILKMLNDYKYFERFLNGWITKSYEWEIERLTKLTKEFSDELTNYSTSAGQSELFSQSISH